MKPLNTDSTRTTAPRSVKQSRNISRYSRRDEDYTVPGMRPLKLSPEILEPFGLNINIHTVLIFSDRVVLFSFRKVSVRPDLDRYILLTHI